MIVVVTRDVAARFRGFLASCMLEIGPGVYTAPRMTAGARDRVWAVMEEWFDDLSGGSIIMTWRDPALPGGQQVRVLGTPPCELFKHDGVYLAKKREVPIPADASPAEPAERRPPEK